MKIRQLLRRPCGLLRDFKHFSGKGTSLRARLLILFSLFLLAVIAGVLIILLMTGVLNNGEKIQSTWMENELSHLEQGVNQDFGKLSRLAVSLGEQMSQSLEKNLRDMSIPLGEWPQHPEILHALLKSELPRLMAALQVSSGSGAFLILDATVNPALPQAADSRSGLFLKSTEPYINQAVNAKINLLRGPAELARAQSLQLMPQWQMEFTVAQDDFYHLVKTQALNHKHLPLSRLYHWSCREMLEGNSESGLLLTVPMLSTEGIFLGVCGFECSAIRFKNMFSPDNQIYPQVLSAFAPVRGQGFSMKEGLIAGDYYQMNADSGQINKITAAKSSYYSYKGDGYDYAGLHALVKLYPNDSVFTAEQWICAVLMPTEEVEKEAALFNQKLYQYFLILLIVSLGLAVFISQRYVRPVLQALRLVQGKESQNLPKSHIHEIDDLFQFLASQAETEAALAAVAKPMLDYQTFTENIKTLSPAEKSVFNLYMLGHNAQEIASILYLSINTIKTHNKRIYMKLNVSSRKELMLYAKMMEEQGKNSAKI